MYNLLDDMIQTVTHCFEPVFDENSRVLLLGTMPSPKSRENGFYYSHPQNRFWRVMAYLLEQETPQSPAQKREMLLANGIAVWDVLRSCSIAGASDASIRDAVPNDLSVIVKSARISAVFTTGQKAYALYKRHCEKETGIEAIGLPSTSPANRARRSFEALTAAYSVMLAYLR